MKKSIFLLAMFFVSTATVANPLPSVKGIMDGIEPTKLGKDNVIGIMQKGESHSVCNCVDTEKVRRIGIDTIGIDTEKVRRVEYIDHHSSSTAVIGLED